MEIKAMVQAMKERKVEEERFRLFIQKISFEMEQGTVEAQFQFTDGSKIYVEPGSRKPRFRTEKSPNQQKTGLSVAEKLLKECGIKVKLPREKIKPKRMLRPVE